MGMKCAVRVKYALHIAVKFMKSGGFYRRFFALFQPFTHFVGASLIFRDAFGLRGIAATNKEKLKKLKKFKNFCLKAFCVGYI